ncbi:hypothetical protein PYCC9005_004821 [Savitreella phatthalungensis]
MGHLNVQVCNGHNVELYTSNAVPAPLQVPGCHFAITAQLEGVLTQAHLDMCELRICLREVHSIHSVVEHGQTLQADDEKLGAALDMGHINVISHPRELAINMYEHYHPSDPQTEVIHRSTGDDEQCICLSRKNGRQLMMLSTSDAITLKSGPCSSTEDGVHASLAPVNHGSQAVVPGVVQMLGFRLPLTTLMKPCVAVQVSVTGSMYPDRFVCLRTSELGRAMQAQAVVREGCLKWAELHPSTGLDSWWYAQEGLNIHFYGRRSTAEERLPAYEEIADSRKAKRADVDVRSRNFMRAGKRLLYANELLRGRLDYVAWDDKLQAWLAKFPDGELKTDLIMVRIYPS